ncbi:uncharacterized protein LOC121886146 [Scomber scombrus]|uniref:Uncharacterized protein LOC121886146 n=1 Tax=Scomber scombrus TaxID=13677 RepID=A0AAV1NVJ1_SCOSC
MKCGCLPCLSSASFMVISSFHREGKSVAAFQSGVTTAAMDIINGATPTKADGAASRIARDIAKELPDFRPVWLVHHPTTASGHDFKAFLLEKCQSWAPATIVRLQKTQTNRYRAATTEIISCCFKEGQTRKAMNMKELSKKQLTELHRRLEESTQRAMDVIVLMNCGGQQSSTASVKQHDIFRAATPNSGSSSVKFSDISQLEIHNNTASIMKKNEHLNLDEDSLLQKNARKQLPLKAASGVDDDGSYFTRPLSLVSRDKKESMNRLQYKIRAARDHNKERFNGKIITKQLELQHPEGDSDTGQSYTDTIEHILQTYFTYKTQDNDTEVRDEVLIVPFLPDAETQTKPSCEIKLILNTDTGWNILNIPTYELNEPTQTNKVIKEGFMIQPAITASTTATNTATTPATTMVTTTTTTVSTYTKENVKETSWTTEHPQTDGVTRENMGINYTEQEENMPSDPITPSPPAHKKLETEDTNAETTAANIEIKQTIPIMEVFTINSAHKADRLLPNTEETQTTTMTPEPETVYKPRFIKCKTGNVQPTTAKPISGLRMREDILEDPKKLHKGIKHGEEAYVSLATTNRPEFTSSKPLQTLQNQVTDTLQKVETVAHVTLHIDSVDRSATLNTAQRAGTEFQPHLI